METNNISTLKIHKLTQAQYDRELAAGNIDANALYLTPDNGNPYQILDEAKEYTDSQLATQLEGKADFVHVHNEYVTSDYANATFLTKDEAFDGEIDLSGYVTTVKLDETVAEINESLENKSDLGHDHDDIYCTKTEIEAEVDSVTTAAKNYTDEKTSGLVSESTFTTTVDEINEELDNHTHEIADVSGLQNALNGKAPVEHGVHVEYSYTAPVMDGTASTGTANTVARSDHKHPTDTSRASVTALDQLTETVGKKADTSSLTSHTGNKSNPHGVTCAQIGAQPAGSYAAASHGNHVPTTQTANNAVFLRNDNTWQTVTPANIGAQPAGSYAASSHTHDDRYYTETEVDSKLSGKANSSHGNHVPATQTASNKIFLRNDNTWQTITPANIGAQPAGSYAAASHGTHVSYGTSATAVGSTASAGSAATVSRSDHTHSLSKSAVTTALGYTPPTTNTTYSAGTGLTLSGTTFSVNQSAVLGYTPSYIKIVKSGSERGYSSSYKNFSPLNSSSTSGASVYMSKGNLSMEEIYHSEGDHDNMKLYAVKIGSNINAVRVSANVGYENKDSSNGGALHTYLTHLTSTGEYRRHGVKYGYIHSGGFLSESIDTIINVSSGDYLILYSYKGTANRDIDVLADEYPYGATYMCVEAIG